LVLNHSLRLREVSFGDTLILYDPFTHFLPCGSRYSNLVKRRFASSSLSHQVQTARPSGSMSSYFQTSPGSPAILHSSLKIILHGFSPRSIFRHFDRLPITDIRAIIISLRLPQHLRVEPHTASVTLASLYSDTSPTSILAEAARGGRHEGRRERHQSVCRSAHLR
jgi:hypothetical protein